MLTRMYQSTYFPFTCVHPGLCLMWASRQTLTHVWDCRYPYSLLTPLPPRETYVPHPLLIVQPYCRGQDLFLLPSLLGCAHSQNGHSPIHLPVSLRIIIYLLLISCLSHPSLCRRFLLSLDTSSSTSSQVSF